MKYILGVDSGATKTHAGVADETGKILGDAKSGPSNIKLQTEEDFKKNIQDAVKAALKNANLKIDAFDAAVLGIAGTDSEELLNKARGYIKDIITVNTNKLLVVNDIQIVRSTCSDKKFGIAVIVGTGSNFYGINKKGEAAYVGGLDWRLSDEGSGYWCGQEALRAAVRSFDGRGPKTIIEDLIKEKFSISSIRELVNIVYEDNFGKKEIAELHEIVDTAYKNKDKVAESIQEQAAKDIAEAINTIIKKLKMENDNFNIVAAGGRFESPFPFFEKVLEKLIVKNADFVICDRSPFEGAVAIAKQLLNTKK